MKNKALFLLAATINLIVVLGIGYLTNPEFGFNWLLIRLKLFLPQTWIFLGLAVSISIVLKILYARRNATMAELTNIKGWSGVRMFTATGLMVFVVGPISEELIFRLPLLIVFSKLSVPVWIALSVGAVLFALIHLPGLEIWDRTRDMYRDKKNLELSPEEFNRIKSQLEPIKQKPATIIARILTAFAGGLIYGYSAVHSQALWPAIKVHALWNIGALIALPLLSLVIGTIFYLVISVVDSIKIRYWLDKNITNF